MNTVIDPVVERSVRTSSASGPGGAVGDPAFMLRLLGAASAVLVASHLVLVLVFVPQWPVGLAAVAWSAVGLPIAMVLIAIAMWRTRAAHPVLLGAWIAGSAAVGALGVVAAVMGDPEFGGDLEMWLTIAALGAGYLVALDELARGRWRGVLRVLPVVAASWGPVVLIVILATDEGTAWWAFILHLCIGTTLLGTALAVRPSDASVWALDPRDAR